MKAYARTGPPMSILALVGSALCLALMAVAPPTASPIVSFTRRRLTDEERDLLLAQLSADVAFADLRGDNFDPANLEELLDSFDEGGLAIINLDDGRGGHRYNGAEPLLAFDRQSYDGHRDPAGFDFVELLDSYRLSDEVGHIKPEGGDGRRKRRKPIEGDIRPLMCGDGGSAGVNGHIGHVDSAGHRPPLLN